MDEKPQAPGPYCTNRERRLHERNVAKYERELQQKYKKYRATWKKQQKLINSPACAQISRAVALTLPRLESITLSTIGSCSHALSQRYIQDFPLSCSMPMDQDSEHAVAQLKLLILPTGKQARNSRPLRLSLVCGDPICILTMNRATSPKPEVFECSCCEPRILRLYVGFGVSGGLPDTAVHQIVLSPLSCRALRCG